MTLRVSVFLPGFCLLAVVVSAAADLPLHEAARKGDSAQAAALIAKGADINAKTTNGWTPLRLADSNGRKDIVKLLENHVISPVRNPR